MRHLSNATYSLFYRSRSHMDPFRKKMLKPSFWFCLVTMKGEIAKLVSKKCSFVTCFFKHINLYVTDTMVVEIWSLTVFSSEMFNSIHCIISASEPCFKWSLMGLINKATFHHVYMYRRYHHHKITTLNLVGMLLSYVKSS